MANGRSSPDWFPFYVDDFLTSNDVQDMTWEEVGIYVYLLCRSWKSSTPPYLRVDQRLKRTLEARLVNPEKTVEEVLEIILEKFTYDTDNELYFNPRFRDEYEKLVKRLENCRKSAKLGGEATAKRTAKRRRKGRSTQLQLQSSSLKKKKQESESGKNDSDSPPNGRAVEAAQIHFDTLSRLGMKVGKSREEFVEESAPAFESAFRNGWTDPEEIATVFEFIGRPEGKFWVDKVLSAKRLFMKRADGTRKINQIVSQARASSSGGISPRDEGTYE